MPGHVEIANDDVGIVFADRGDRLVGGSGPATTVERVAEGTRTQLRQIE